MKNEAFLALSYLRYHKFKSAVICLSFTLIFSLPLLLSQSQETLQELSLKRAKSTPLILGSKGSRLDLALHALYFKKIDSKPMRQGSKKRLDKIKGLSYAPINSSFTSNEIVILGSNQTYFEKRGLNLAQGKISWQIGDCLIGSEVAKNLQLKIGDKLKSDVKNAFDFRGQYPLEMTITGIMDTSHGADDNIILTSLETVWTIAGIGHGHSESEESKGKNFQSIDDQNRELFHFHGDESDFPLTALLIFPESDKAKAICLGEFQNDFDLQIIKSEEVVNEALNLLIKFQNIFKVLMSPVILSSLFLIILTFTLMWQNRKEERKGLIQLGASRAFIFKQSFIEYGTVLGVAAIFSSLFLVLIKLFDQQLLKFFLSL